MKVHIPIYHTLDDFGKVKETYNLGKGYLSAEEAEKIVEDLNEKRGEQIMALNMKFEDCMTHEDQGDPVWTESYCQLMKDIGVVESVSDYSVMSLDIADSIVLVNYVVDTCLKPDLPGKAELREEVIGDLAKMTKQAMAHLDDFDF